MNRRIQLSKTMSFILRHGAEKAGLQLQTGGFLYTDDLLKLPQLKGFSIDDITEVVNKDNKNRFCMEQDASGKLKIRANQGHSVQVDGLELTEIKDASVFPVVVHGTNFSAWQQIQTSGLNRMKRNHIHFAPGLPTDDGVISGMRNNCDVIIYIDLQQALADGLQFYLSANNVILTAGDSNGLLKPQYFSKVIEKKTGKVLFQAQPSEATAALP